MKTDKDILLKAQDITMTHYDYYHTNGREEVVIPVEELHNMLEDLICEYGVLEEKFEDYKQNVQDNYKQITPSEMYGISDKDFI